MSGPAAAKTCGICGADCTGRPRTKDKSGRYFCKECYDGAIARKHADDAAPSHVERSTSKMSAKAAATVSAAPPDDEFGMLNELLTEQAGAAVQLGASGRLCTNFRAQLPGNAMICVTCGFNTQTGEMMKVKRVAAKLPRSATGRTVWPIVIGILCIVFGGPGTILYGLSLALTLVSGNLSTMNHKQLLISLGGQGLAFSLSAWELLAGIGVLRRRRTAFYLLRRWATLTIILTVVFGGLLIIALSNAGSAGPRGQPLDQKTMDIMAAVLAGALVAGLAWPGFLLFWTMRKNIVAEVDEHFV